MRASDRRDWMLILAAMVLALAFCSVAQANQPCGLKARIEARLSGQYGEVRV